MSRKIKNAPVYLLLSLYSVFCVYPLIWLGVNSLKTTSELYANPWGFTNNLQLINYIKAWVNGNIGTYFLNSLVVVVTSLLVILVLVSMSAFALQRMRWKLAGPCKALLLSGIMIPIHATLIPIFMLFSDLGVRDNRFTLVLPYVAISIPVSVYILCSFMSTLPREIEEAAVVDGCGIWRLFLRVILPMSKTGLITITIYNFVTLWNELLFGLVLVTDVNRATLPAGLNKFVNNFATDWATLLAGVMISVVPSVIVFIALHERIIEGVTAGAVKG